MKNYIYIFVNKIYIEVLKLGEFNFGEFSNFQISKGQNYIPAQKTAMRYNSGKKKIHIVCLIKFGIYNRTF